jgi:hypothetical protein
MMIAAGGIFLILGLVSGLFLTLAPFGIGGLAPSATAWVLFPALTIVGYLMVIFATREAAVPLVTRIAGALLLALAVGAVVGLFLVGNALVAPAAGTLALWYVLAIGFVLGTVGVSVRRGT